MAHVSTSTVSRVLNDDPKVRPATAERVRAAMKRLGYRPNEIARSLRGFPSRTIGLIIADISNPFYADCAKAVEEIARQNQYLLVLCVSDEMLDTEREHVELLVQRRVDGLLLVPSAGDHSYLRTITDVPLVAFDRPMHGETSDVVLVQNRVGARHITEHLIEHGHERIACVGDDEALYTTQERLIGYRAAMRAAGLEPIYRRGGPTTATARATMRELLAEPHPPTAVFAANNLIMVGVLHAIDDAGLRVPDDVALAGFDDFELAGLLRPRLTVVRQPAGLLGECAATLLLERLEAKRDGPPKKKVLPTELVIRESCGCR
jgi:LacI family transcriptional regulator